MPLSGVEVIHSCAQVVDSHSRNSGQQIGNQVEGNIRCIFIEFFDVHAGCFETLENFTRRKNIRF